jgi:hypothetical protein
MDTFLQAVTKKKVEPEAPLALAEPTILPLVQKEHEGACGDNCDCADGADGCC